MNKSSIALSGDSKPSVCAETKARLLDLRAQRERLAQRDARRMVRRADGYLPPASNTGGKGSPSAESFRAQVTHIDTLTVTMEICSLGDSSNLELMMHDDEAIKLAVDREFLNFWDFEVGLPNGKRVNGYKDSAPIRVSGYADVDALDKDGKPKENPFRNVSFGYVAWGGNRNKAGNDTLCIHFTGQACESMNLLDAMGTVNLWGQFSAALMEHNAAVTRIDIAFDDMAGEHGGIGAAVGWYRQGGFTNGGRPPSICQHGDWINGHSRTFEVGKRANGKMLRIYEKGHQLGDESDPWLRYELEIRAQDRVIPLSVLTNTDEVLAGSYPAMEWVVDCQPVSIPTIVKRRVRVTLDHLQKYARTSYGRVLHAMQAIGMAPQAILDELAIAALPRRLYVPPSACS